MNPFQSHKFLVLLSWEKFLRQMAAQAHCFPSITENGLLPLAYFREGLMYFIFFT